MSENYGPCILCKGLADDCIVCLGTGFDGDAIKYLQKQLDEERERGLIYEREETYE